MTAAAPDLTERLDWLRLARTSAIGSATFMYLIETYGSAREALNAVPALAERAGRSASPKIPTLAEAKSELQSGEALGARLIICSDPDYPELLRAMDHPPPLLWALGDLGLFNRPCLAMVGARNASAGGQRLSRDLAKGVGQSGWVIVSGLARGIDAAAHRGGLSTGTIAVLAGGVDQVYPTENLDLYDQIVRQGCVVSEQPPGYVAKAKDFPRRNRIISGLARGVVVVEAELRSGSLITARFAGEQGREVLAVPGSPADPRARGANDLIRQGATLVEEAEDVLRHFSDLPLMVQPRATNPNSRPMAPARSDQDNLEEALEQLLSTSPTPFDHLARAIGAPLPAVMAALTELSLSGRAEIIPGGLASRS
jgi:DNA processing protein